MASDVLLKELIILVFEDEKKTFCFICLFEYVY
jgi:hypothetical protein